MKYRFVVGAVCAASMVLAAPALAAPFVAPASFAAGADQAVEAFYAARRGAPLWLRGDTGDEAASALTAVLQRSTLDELRSGPALAFEVQMLLARARSGDPGAAVAAERLMSKSWVLYVEALQRPAAGMTYADPWVVPRHDSPAQILARAAAAPSLAAHVRSVSEVNPLYAQLRDAAWTAMESNGGEIDPRVATSLDRIRVMPFQKKYVMVDAAAARLYMIDDGRIVDSMKVIVGKPSDQTPMLASTIYYATLNPYWHVDRDLVRSLIARNVLDQGLSYLKTRGYQVLAANGSDSRQLDPATVDWHAVADGDITVRVRQLPGPANSMGRIKFGFPNAGDIYLHDTPVKQLFDQDDRDLSHGCIRLADAERLGHWLLGRDPETTSREPEQHVLLPTPVPIYLSYLTAQVENGQLSFVDDIYGRDTKTLEVAALH